MGMASCAFVQIDVHVRFGNDHADAGVLQPPSHACLRHGAVALLHTLCDKPSVHPDNDRQLTDQHEWRDVAKATGGVTASGELPTQRYDRPVSQSEPAREAQLFG